MGVISTRTNIVPDFKQIEFTVNIGCCPGQKNARLAHLGSE
jgi:hypothetical protein